MSEEHKTKLETAIQELKKGKGWEQKNRLMVYQGLLAMCERDFKTASTHFVQALPTFTPCDLLSFKEFVLYTVTTSLVCLDRGVLRAKILESPEILTAVREVPSQYEVLLAICECRYDEFFAHFSILIDSIRTDKCLANYVGYITRNVRLMVYKQFLVAYKSVKIATMADAFGVSSDYIEQDILPFIAGGKLPCKIDSISGLIESNRLQDPRNHLYSQVTRHGDVLLNHLQRLSKVIDV
jgi:26S proteasome regulatory subunit N7